MLDGGGPSGLMWILRGDALENERGADPDLSAIYAPGTHRQARRRFIAVSLFCLASLVALAGAGLWFIGGVFALIGVVLAISTQFEAAWIGSPVRLWTRVAAGVAIVGMGIATVIHM
jgi:hypothetical protein